MSRRRASEDAILDAILAANSGRKKAVVQTKLDKIAIGVFPFFRATNHLFADEWHKIGPLQPGPNGLICGDLHLENFGAYLTDEHECHFGINDFDEAYVAPLAYDLVRCAASTFLAGEDWKLSTSVSAGLVVAFLDAYKQGVATSAVTGKVGEIVSKSAHGPILSLMTPTAVADRDKVIADYTHASGKGGRSINTNHKYGALGRARRKQIEDAFKQLAASSPAHQSIEVLDATTRIAGLGSLGLRHYLVLVKWQDGEDRLRLLDMKESVPSALRAFVREAQPIWGPNEASRTVAAERLIQGKPGRGLAAIDMGERSFRIREMVPDENRSDMARLLAGKNVSAHLRKVVGIAGSIAAWAHVKGIEAAGTAHVEELNAWANGATFDAVMVAAARAAGQAREDFDAYVNVIKKASVRKRLGLGPWKKPESTPNSRQL